MPMSLGLASVWSHPCLTCPKQALEKRPPSHSTFPPQFCTGCKGDKTGHNCADRLLSARKDKGERRTKEIAMTEAQLRQIQETLSQLQRFRTLVPHLLVNIAHFEDSASTQTLHQKTVQEARSILQDVNVLIEEYDKCNPIFQETSAAAAAAAEAEATGSATAVADKVKVEVKKEGANDVVKIEDPDSVATNAAVSSQNNQSDKNSSLAGGNINFNDADMTSPQNNFVPTPQSIIGNIGATNSSDFGTNNGDFGLDGSNMFINYGDY